MRISYATLDLDFRRFSGYLAVDFMYTNVFLHMCELFGCEVTLYGSDTYV